MFNIVIICGRRSTMGCITAFIWYGGSWKTGCEASADLLRTPISWERAACCGGGDARPAINQPCVVVSCVSDTIAQESLGRRYICAMFGSSEAR